MKTFVVSFSLLLAGAFSTTAQGQTAPATAKTTGPAQVQFKTSAVCEMCKARLEKSMAYEKGVQAVNLDVPSKVLTVTYNPAKTTPATLQTAVLKTGYDADALPAEARAYDRLPDCCKKTTD